MATIGYALFGWNRRPDVPAGARSFTVHEKSGWSSVVAGLVVLIVAESIGAHLLLQLWSRRAAWIMTSLDLYGMLWLLGDFNALRARPSLIADDVLRIRYGLRWSLALRRDDITSMRPWTAADAGQETRRSTLKVAMIDDPHYLIEAPLADGRARNRRIPEAGDRDRDLTRSGRGADRLDQRWTARIRPGGVCRRRAPVSVASWLLPLLARITTEPAGASPATSKVAYR